MSSTFSFPTAVFAAAPPATSTDTPNTEEEEYYSSWSLFLVCALLILSLWTSYYLQIKRIRAIHETLVAIFAGSFVGLVVRLAPGTMIRDMLVSRVTDTAPSCGVPGVAMLHHESVRWWNVRRHNTSRGRCLTWSD